MNFDIVILAGGRSRRMGRDKAGIKLAGKTLLEHALTNAGAWGGRRILVAGQARPWVQARYIPDPPGHEPSSLLGIYAGLLASSSPWVLVCACDMPFICREVVELLWAAKNRGGAVARWGRLQPLPGLYPRWAAGVIEEMFAERRYHLARLLDRLEPAVVDQVQIAARDPLGKSFFNVNSLEELAEAERLLRDED
ncbi:MAG: molybdenum cofactor guanylyltransferase [Bacillota bacterium]|jgi:molybdopterin-guanine dinucleotide biosynthesis protein A